MTAPATTWEEICAHPALRDLPFKIELNRFNQIVLAPRARSIPGPRRASPRTCSACRRRARR